MYCLPCALGMGEGRAFAEQLMLNIVLGKTHIRVGKSRNAWCELLRNFQYTAQQPRDRQDSAAPWRLLHSLIQLTVLDQVRYTDEKQSKKLVISSCTLVLWKQNRFEKASTVEYPWLNKAEQNQSWQLALVSIESAALACMYNSLRIFQLRGMCCATGCCCQGNVCLHSFMRTHEHKKTKKALDKPIQLSCLRRRD